MKRLLAVVVLALGLTACQVPTGDHRCDAQTTARAYADAIGWHFDCTPGFTNWSAGEQRYVPAWTDTSHKTIWVWPKAIPKTTGDRLLFKIMMHELGHAYTGSRDEWQADAWAWCNMTPAQRDGITFERPLPTDCEPFL